MDEAPEGRKETRDPGERRAQDEYISSLLQCFPMLSYPSVLHSTLIPPFLFSPVLLYTNVRFLGILSMLYTITTINVVSWVIDARMREIAKCNYSGTRDDNV